MVKEMTIQWNDKLIGEVMMMFIALDSFDFRIAVTGLEKSRGDNRIT